MLAVVVCTVQFLFRNGGSTSRRGSYKEEELQGPSKNESGPEDCCIISGADCARICVAENFEQQQQ